MPFGFNGNQYRSPTATGSVAPDASGRMVISASGIPGSARTSQPAQQPQAQQDPADFFFSPAPSIPIEDEAVYKPDHEQWFRAFAEGFHNREFNTIEDYVKFGTSLPGYYMETTPFVQKQMKEFMPAKLRRQMEDLEAQREREFEMERGLKLSEKYNAILEKKGLPYRYGIDGKTVQANVDLNHQKKIATLAAMEKRMSAMEKMIANESLDSPLPPDFKADYRKLLKAYNNEVAETFAKQMGEDAGAQDSAEEGVIIENPKTGQRLVQRGGQWLPLE